jgi:hypothetical protein
MIGGYSLENVIGDVWTLEVDSMAWMKFDISTKPTPGRFKSAVAMYNPPPDHRRNLLKRQPHIFQVFGVKDFLGGEPTGGLDIWVLTQSENSNEEELRNKGAVDNKKEWKLGRSGTAWFEHTIPHRQVEVVGPCITGTQDSRPSGTDPTCLYGPGAQAALQKTREKERAQKMAILTAAHATRANLGSTPFARLRRASRRTATRNAGALVEVDGGGLL